MTDEDPDSEDLSPEQAKEIYGDEVEGLMRDVVDSCRRHNIRAVSVCAFTERAGAVAFSTGTEAEWRELGRLLAKKMAHDVGRMMKVKPRVTGARNVRRPS